jgi:N-acetylneuraminate synthase
MYESPDGLLFVAEVSANHLGSLSRAKEIIQAAAIAGANAVKFQTYTADTMTLNLPNFSISPEHQLWGGRSLYSLYEEAHTPWEWHFELFSFAKKLGLVPFSSPFDLSALEFLENLDASLYKIASMETCDHELIRAVAETGKPIIMSTGATEWDEIGEAVEVVKSTGNKDLTLLVCTSSYPSIPKDSHIRRIEKLRDEFRCKVGISDHTLGIGVSVAAVALGACVVEKHLTLRRSDGGADGGFSLEPEEFALLVKEGGAAYESLGDPVWRIQESEAESRNLRRSLYIVQDVVAGQVVTKDNLRAIRPAGGAQPKFLGDWVGRKFKDNYTLGTPMRPEYLQ